MKMYRLAACVIVVASFGPELAIGQVPSGDLARLQGRWWTKVVGPSGSGVEVINAIDVTGDRVTTSDVKHARDKTAPAELKLQSTGQLVLNESSSPKTIDFVNTKVSNAQLGEIKFPDFFGIYEIDGDTVKFCINNGIVTKTRPRVSGKSSRRHRLDHVDPCRAVGRGAEAGNGERQGHSAESRREAGQG